MISDGFQQQTSFVLDLLSSLFVFTIGLALFAVVVIYFIDVTQKTHTIRRNYPVIGRFRYIFEHLGEFFRQYFFAMDREEMPFNRAQRSWVYRAAKNIDNTIAFGSTRDLKQPGTILFANCPYPSLSKDSVETPALTIGADCLYPYMAKSLFNISGMSYGAISKPAVQALSYGALKANCWLNTGEGAISPYHLESGCDLVFQIGTAKYGVRSDDGLLSDAKLRDIAAIEQVRMFEIKLSQGAKPGKGGILPAAKITPEIAKIRGIPLNQDSLSPNRHEDINSDEDLLDMIDRVRRVTGKPVGFKMVLGDVEWLDLFFKEIVARGFASAPDFITLDSADGGTGAAPMSLIDYMGLTIKESLPMLVDKLNEYGLRHRVKVIVSGKLVTPADLAWALCIGTDFITSARGFMFSLGCIQALQCNKNSCPTGIATHNLKLQRGLVSELKSERVKYYVENMLREVGVIAHSCGVSEPRQLCRSHARMVMEDSRSVALSELCPDIVKRGD